MMGFSQKRQRNTYGQFELVTSLGDPQRCFVVMRTSTVSCTQYYFCVYKFAHVGRIGNLKSAYALFGVNLCLSLNN